MLRIEDITVRYQKKEILRHVTCSFPEGCTTAIVGESGIGKTTLLNLLAGLLRPQEGKVLSDYRRPAYIFQEPRLFPWMTALENVTAVCHDTKRASAILEQLLPHAARLYPHELSGGMKQRVSVARALAYEPDLLLMDEPFKGLDEQTRQAVFDCVFTAMRGKTVLMVTHDRADREACPQILSMQGSPVTTLCLEKNGNVKI